MCDLFILNIKQYKGQHCHQMIKNFFKVFTIPTKGEHNSKVYGTYFNNILRRVVVLTALDISTKPSLANL